jgi:hypothetical protein
MNKELEKKSLGTGILRLPKNKGVENTVTADQILKNSNPSNEEDTLLSSSSSCSMPSALSESSPPLEPKPDFQTIYDELHGKFPEVINMNKPVLLAVGIRKEMSKETGVSSVVLKRWIAWYCRKSNYYANHTQGAIRFHLDGSEAGIVTENHQEKMEKRLEKTKVCKTTRPLENKNKDSDNSLSATIINDVK